MLGSHKFANDTGNDFLLSCFDSRFLNETWHGWMLAYRVVFLLMIVFLGTALRGFLLIFGKNGRLCLFACVRLLAYNAVYRIYI